MLCVQFYSVCEILLSVLFFTMCVKLYTQSKIIHCLLNYTLCLNLHSLCKKNTVHKYTLCVKEHTFWKLHISCLQYQSSFFRVLIGKFYTWLKKFTQPAVVMVVTNIRCGFYWLFWLSTYFLLRFFWFKNHTM